MTLNQSWFLYSYTFDFLLQLNLELCRQLFINVQLVIDMHASDGKRSANINSKQI